MLRRICVALAFAAQLPLVGAGTLQSQTTSNAPAENARQLLGLIDSFLASPFQPDLRTALIDSAEARPDVSLTLSASVVPTMCYEETVTVVAAMDALLLTAYIAGNMREQLITGRKGDAPYGGVVATLSVYDIIRKRVGNYSVPELEEWRVIQAAGTLQAFADSLAQHPLPDCPKKKVRYPNARIERRD